MTVAVGLIGAGLQGRRRAQAIRVVDGANLVVVTDVNEERARELAKHEGCRIAESWERVIDDQVDVVLICTPPHLHAPIGIAAAAAGKHVLCEKPLARTVSEAETMVRAFDQAGVSLWCGLNHRFHPGIQQAHQWVEQGRIGKIGFVRCVYGIGGRPDYDQDWRMRVEMGGGGQLMDQGVHALDLCRWFLGEFREAFAFLSSQFWTTGPLEDNAFALLRTEAGQVASVHVSWTQWRPLFSFEVFGDDGYVRVEGLGGSYGVERAVLGLRDLTGPFRENVVEFRGEDVSWNQEWQQVLAAMMGRDVPLANAEDGLAALRLTTALYESSRAGCVVRLAGA